MKWQTSEWGDPATETPLAGLFRGPEFQCFEWVTPRLAGGLGRSPCRRRFPSAS
jgi:hypothetical protein